MKRNPILLTLLAGFLILACAQKRPQLAGNTEAEKLHSYFDWSFDELAAREPMKMGYWGIRKKEDQLDDLSLDYLQQTQEMRKEHLRILHTFGRDEMTKADQLNYDLYEQALNREIHAFDWHDSKYLVNQMFGMQSEAPSFMISIHKIKTEEDLRNYISRLNQFKTIIGQTVNGLMRSETQGVVPPKFVFPLVIGESKNLISGNPFVKSKTDSPLFADFKSKMKSLNLSTASQKKYTQEAEQALLQSVGPAYAELIAFLEKQEKRATTQAGIWKFPNGDEYYKHLLKKYTTTDLSPEQIHQLGLDNVARIHKEMEAIAQKIKFKGDLQSFFKYMKSNKFYFSNNKNGKKRYLKKATNYIDTMEKKLDKMFATKPKASIEVMPVEPYREKSAGMAFYSNATPDGSRPGIYYVNLSNMKALPSWEAEALAYHEGIPGHHMQISIAQELQNVPNFRRFTEFTAYVEGWGLYSERLPKDFGFYADPHSDFGRLSMELVRACRLVVDSGLHHKKWTREQAIAYLDKNLPGDHNDNIRQINRYIVMPGQATAYMVGMLKIVELREKAKKEMGQKFDIRQFHDVVLKSGSVPMETLESLVDSYIKGV